MRHGARTFPSLLLNLKVSPAISLRYIVASSRYRQALRLNAPVARDIVEGSETSRRDVVESVGDGIVDIAIDVS